MITLPNAHQIAKLKELTDEQWHTLRMTGIGGSDAGAIMGYSRYATPLSKWMEKTGRMRNEAESEQIDVGNILESFIRDDMLPDYLCKFFPGIDFKIYEPKYMYRSILNPFQIINPDGFIDVNEKLDGLEIKTGSSYMLKYWGGKDGDLVPDDYYCQVQHYMAGTGLDEWMVFALIGNQRVFRIVPRNDDFIDDMIIRESQFWEKVELNDPLYAPMPMGLDADDDAIMALNSPQEETTVDLSEAEYLIDRYEQLKVELQDKEEEREIISQKVKLLLDKSKYGETGNYRVTFSRFERTSVDTKALRKDHPAIVDSYTKKSESGRLSVKGRK